VATEIKYASRFEVVLPERPLFVKGLGDKIQQILLNLLINARQAMPQRHASENLIRLELRREGKDAFLEVSDNGEGVPPEALRHIFDPFYTTKAPGVGTGLGLSISYQIAKEHGGQISVRSTLGKGTIFTLKLPLWEGSPDRHTILIIDDEERNLNLFKRALRGFDVVTATGVTAATRLLDSDFKAIVSDVRLQDGSGFDIYEKAPPYLQERFIFLTALPPDAAELSRRPLQSAILHKPVQLDELEVKLMETINRVTAPHHI
jgi:CheY-like chemotaxis protein